MIFAAIGDIHGNMTALNSVINEIDEMGIQTILNTGDCIVGAQWPDDVIELLHSRNIPTCQGAMDRAIVRFMKKRKSFIKKYSEETFNAMEWTFENTLSENLEFLRSLPKQERFCIDTINIFLCHGSPSGQSISLNEDDDVERFRRQREIEPVDIIICGQTHSPFYRMVDGTLFVNPGSVGMHSIKEKLASYALVNTEESPWTVELRSIQY